MDKIVLGSGTVYIDEFASTIPEDSTIEVEAKLLGYIQGGASIEYKPTYYTTKDDSGKMVKTILTDEEVTFKSGILTWCGETLKKLCSTARVTSTTTLRTVKIGGISNQDGKKYLIRFVHEDAEQGAIRLTIVGNNQSGFSLAFAKDKETVIDAEFKALPHDTDGTLITYTEEIPAA